MYQMHVQRVTFKINDVVKTSDILHTLHINYDILIVHPMRDTLSRNC
jgi:hypothetical protein